MTESFWFESFDGPHKTIAGTNMSQCPAEEKVGETDSGLPEAPISGCVDVDWDTYYDDTCATYSSKDACQAGANCAVIMKEATILTDMDVLSDEWDPSNPTVDVFDRCVSTQSPAWGHGHTVDDEGHARIRLDNGSFGIKRFLGNVGGMGLKVDYDITQSQGCQFPSDVAAVDVSCWFDIQAWGGPKGDQFLANLHSHSAESGTLGSSFMELPEGTTAVRFKLGTIEASHTLESTIRRLELEGSVANIAVNP